MNKLQSFAVYGGGSWGTALACAAARAGNKDRVDLYLRDTLVVDEILQNRTNSKYLGQIILPENIHPTSDISAILNKDMLIIAVPSVAFTETITTLAEMNIARDTILLIATKGLIEDLDGAIKLLSDEIRSILPNQVVFISGPNFAHELAQNLLTSITIACQDLAIAERIAVSIKSENLITSVTDDIVTVQIAGAMKNIIAIKSGIYDAMGYKKNAKAWLITQGLKEIMDLSLALGGRMKTLFEPAVLGDLVLTCHSQDSRNTRFGYELYGQKDVKTFLANYPVLVEGVHATRLVMKLATQYKVELPIISSVAAATTPRNHHISF